ncbi:MAG: hypothetical protein ACI8QZ_003733 [Chlamydiales bacterium]|jgi:hypothetical protein
MEDPNEDWTGDELTCEVVWIMIQGFASGDTTPDGEHLMRVHMAHCGECRDEYRSAMVTMARIGGERRRNRVENERQERHDRLRAMAFQAAAPPSGKFHRMRTMLYPAFFAFLLFQVSRMSVAVAGVSVTGLTGEVSVRDEGLEPTAELTAERGDWCLTGPDSSARLDAKHAVVLVGPSSAVIVQRAAPARYRLDRGSLEIEGSCTIDTRWGIVDLKDGRARVVLEARGVEVECHAGLAAFTGMGGSVAVDVDSIHRSWL